uniref:Venom endoribonuclease n=1 Tax=Lethocerus distinctifemur TaxID=280095 RepID=A0A2K8JL43_9HEMI|nr:venom endoribonuclease [Lethocerus distinctifemur]
MTTIALVFLLALCVNGEPQPLQAKVDLSGYSRTVLDRDVNNVGKYLGIDLQHSTSQPAGQWNRPLLIVPREVNRVDTIQKLQKLYASEGENSADVTDFLNAVVATDVMKHTMDYLRSIGKFSGNQRDFVELLRRLWFTTYKKGSERSSGFKHVFMGETKRGLNQKLVNGFHSWVFFAHQQEKNRIQYKGWHTKKVFNNDKGSLLSLRFDWNGAFKSYGSMFVGTSPELEMALYTACFLAADRLEATCSANIGGHNVRIKAVPKNDLNGNLILTTYPES